MTPQRGRSGRRKAAIWGRCSLSGFLADRSGSRVEQPGLIWGQLDQGHRFTDSRVHGLLVHGASEHIHPHTQFSTFSPQVGTLKCWRRFGGYSLNNRNAESLPGQLTPASASLPSGGGPAARGGGGLCTPQRCCDDGQHLGLRRSGSLRRRLCWTVNRRRSGTVT